MLPLSVKSVALLLLGGCIAAPDEQIVISNRVEASDRPLNIAVIGAGPAGASSAYHLEKFGGGEPNITIFERSTYIGGRSTTVDAYGDPRLPVELGASIFVKINKLLVNTAKEFNLSTMNLLDSSSAKIPGAALGVWNGQQFVYIQNGDRPWWDKAKMLWKYGLDPIKTINLVKPTVAKFMKMYGEPIFPFRSLTKAVHDVGLLDVTATTGDQYMTANGITGAFKYDIVQASTRVNYAMNLQISGIVAMVCMAIDGAVAIDGGNWQIFDRMVKKSRAKALLQTQVTAVNRNEDGSYALSFKDASDSALDATSHQTFDSVILAAPHQYAGISFDPPLQHVPDEIPYVELHVTLFTSPRLLSPEFFGLPRDSLVPKVILTTLPPGERPDGDTEVCGSPGFYSISLLDPVTHPESGKEEYLYKIFSPNPTNATFLAGLLGIDLNESHGETNISKGVISWIYRKIWNSYPYEFPRVTYEDMQLDNGVFYTGGMESFISTMETSALAGMNAARLAIDDWETSTKGEFGRIKQDEIFVETLVV